MTTNTFVRETPSNKYHRIFQTLNEMLKDRGYYVEDLIYQMSYGDFVERFVHTSESDSITADIGNKFNISNLESTYNPELPGLPIRVFYEKGKALSWKGLQTKFKEFEEKAQMNKGSYRAILVLEESPTPAAKKSLKQDVIYGEKIEIFLEEDLLINVTKHELVPKHVKQTVAEKAAIMEKYRATEDKFPLIRKADPVARYLGLLQGDMVSITRASESAGVYVGYRICADI